MFRRRVSEALPRSGKTMSAIGIVILLFVAGMLVLVAEIFIPSHGVLSLTGIVLLTVAVVQTFQHAGREVGVAAIVACMVFVPTFGYLAVKYWPQTPVGRRMSPPNPILTADDAGVPVAELRKFVGQVGRSVSPLRPVGIGEFNGRRVSCVAETGMIDAHETIEAIDVLGSNVKVAVRKG